MTTGVPPISEILEAFELIDDWEERYRYVIELGRELPPFPEEERTPENKVRGCVSQVWLVTRPRRENGGPPRLTFLGDSDAMIVRGLVAIMLALFNDRTPEEISATDVEAVLSQMQLREHLTPQRSNGLTAMVRRIKAEAEAAAAATAA